MKSLILMIFIVRHVSLVQITVTNKCSYKIWVGQTGNPTLSDGTVGLAHGASHTYQIPSGGWSAGRMWPKVGCNGSGQNCKFGQSVPPCPSGGCQPPADTKVEFTIPSQGSRGNSWYDISLVDGYSQPVSIVPSNQGGSCISTNCNINFGSCPQNEISGLGDLRAFVNGQVMACLSPCKKWNYPSPWGQGHPENQDPGLHVCCPTPPISSGQCRSGPVVNTQYVKQVRANCPTAYSYAYDDEAGLHQCSSNTNFAVTFCPNNNKNQYKTEDNNNNNKYQDETEDSNNNNNNKDQDDSLETEDEKGLYEKIYNLLLRIKANIV